MMGRSLTKMETFSSKRQKLVFEHLSSAISLTKLSKKQLDVSALSGLTVKLKESVTSLDAVVITAGTFEAGDKARVSVLKPLDIVTTAGAAGDIIGALTTLPGTQTVGEDGRLFVRGGEANETQTFVDGMRVAQPYGPTANNTPTEVVFHLFCLMVCRFLQADTVPNMAKHCLVFYL
jgi:hypothetical protein